MKHTTKKGFFCGRQYLPTASTLASLIWTCCVRLNSALPNYSVSGQGKHWSDCADRLFGLECPQMLQRSVSRGGRNISVSASGLVLIINLILVKKETRDPRVSNCSPEENSNCYYKWMLVCVIKWFGRFGARGTWRNRYLRTRTDIMELMAFNQ